MSIVIQVRSLHNACLSYGNILSDTQECIYLYHICSLQSSCDLFMPPGIFPYSDSSKVEQKLMALHLTWWCLFLVCSSSCKECLLMMGVSLLSELQLAGRMRAVELYHETELLLPHECHEIQNMMWTMKPTFLCGFLKSKFRRSDHEFPCFVHLMTAKYEGSSLRDALMRLLPISTFLESPTCSHKQQIQPSTRQKKW